MAERSSQEWFGGPGNGGGVAGRSLIRVGSPLGPEAGLRLSIPPARVAFALRGGAERGG